MSARSVIMILVLVALVVLLVIGRLHRQTHVRPVRHHATSALLRRIDRSVAALERLETRELRRLHLSRGDGPSGHPAPAGKTPQST